MTLKSSTSSSRSIIHVIELSRRSGIIIKSKLNIDSNEIDKILSKLVKEGYLKLGVSLAV